MSDEPLLWAAFGILLVGLALSVVFSAAEAAFAAASRAKIQILAKAGQRRARRALRLLEAREPLAGALAVGNGMVVIGTALLAASAFTVLFGPEGLLAALIGLPLLFIFLAGILPRALATASPESAALALSAPAAVAVALLGPVAAAAARLARGIVAAFGVEASESRGIFAAGEEIRDHVDLLHREGGVAKAERDMLGGLLDLNELTVADVMVHRTKMRTIDADLPAEEIVRETLSSPYTRLPLWRGKPDNIVGVLHAKDLLRALDAVGGQPSRLKVEAIALESWFVPDTTGLREQLRGFLARKTHFALVVDEYGEVQGLVTLEDILEEIVGDIADEHDVALTGVRPQPDGSVHVDGSVPIRDLNRALDWSLPDEEATTIAGLVIHEARAIPETGQVFNFHGFRFKVLRKSRNRITALRITPLAPKREPGEAAAEAPHRGA